MKEFFELRTYKIYSGKMKEWVNFMEEIIIQFQIKCLNIKKVFLLRKLNIVKQQFMIKCYHMSLT